MNKIVIALLVLVLTGCSTFRKPEEKIVVRTVVESYDIPLKVSPRPISMTDVKWYTVTTDNIDEFEANFENSNGDLVFFAISVPHYENLSLNLADIRRFIEQQKAIIVYYEDQIRESQESINKTTNNESGVN